MFKESGNQVIENFEKFSPKLNGNGVTLQEKLAVSLSSNSIRFSSICNKSTKLNSQFDTSCTTKQSNLLPVKLSKFSKKCTSITSNFENSFLTNCCNGISKQSYYNGSPPKRSDLIESNSFTLKNKDKTPIKSTDLKQEMFQISKQKTQPVYKRVFGVFKEDHEVLARWSDGLYYLGTVHQVCDFEQRCYVQFEDKSTCWVLFKDLQPLNKEFENGTESDLTCAICHDGKSEKPNEIVLCDKCGQGFHQLCHVPSIAMQILNEEDESWQCRTCIFAAAAKKGGADQDGLAASALKQMKEELPYDISLLSWDKGHKSNMEETYCYCGGPGDWYLKMLQCCRCSQWFHEACLQCLNYPILYGDRFFLFVCSICNSGNEFLKRLPMRWVDVVHLVLYNITITKTNKYYEFSSSIIPYFSQNWESLRLGELVHEASTRSQLKDRVLETLQNNKSRFQCGSESKKSKMSWGLKTRSPPSPPAVNIPSTGVINESLFQSMDLRHGSLLINDSPTPLKRSAPGDLSESPPHKSQFRDLVDWNPVTPRRSSEDRHSAARDNLFERFYEMSADDNKAVDIANRIDKQKRKRGRPRKDALTCKSALPSPPPCPQLPSNSGKQKKKESTRLKSDQVSYTSESSVIPLSELFRDIPGSKLPDSLAATDKGESELRRTMVRYFGAEGRIACGERFNVLAKRVSNGTDGTPRVEYLIEWEGYTAKQLHDRVQKR